jgi:hypothetical protein
MPPLTFMLCPVMWEEADDSRKAATLATSSALPIRPNGIRGVAVASELISGDAAFRSDVTE